MTKILPFIAIAILFLVGGYVLYRKISIQTNPTIKLPQTVSSPSSNNQSFKTFKSSTAMKFAITLPEEYQIEEKFGSVTISSGKGFILITQNSTNFGNLDDYLKFSKNNLQNNITNRKASVIDGKDTVSGFIGEEKIHYIYADNNIYMISTKSESLYDDLDQIALSFRYTP